jgi:predicted Zn-dependent protease
MGYRVSMSEKSRRRLMLEQSLAEDPTDPFLRYGVAVQCLREGDVEEGRERLLALIEDHPDNQVAAYQQLGQSYADTGETEAAAATLRTGIAKAQAAGDWHAAAEMEQLVASLG